MSHQILAALAALAVGAASAAQVDVDYAKTVRPVRPALHSSGFASLMNRPFAKESDAWIKSMNFDFVRTHDLALVNAGSRVVDNHFIFPLAGLDATKEENYYFKSTDYLLQLQRALGLKIFYRLGTSIEHTGEVHFNALVPDDFGKVAENFAATIRHYNKGWAKGFEWNIPYWEIWNEPDGIRNMWCLPGKEGKDAAAMRAKFVAFFVTCLKRLKGEFPDVKVGGPALCSAKTDYVRALLQGCKEAGVKPDFLSWHYYGRKPVDLIAGAAKVKAVVDAFGMGPMEYIINEWHYLPNGGFAALRSRNPKSSVAANEGPASINGIDSAAFTLTTLAALQTSIYDQAYFYGCRHVGSWGFRDERGRLNKNYYALKAFGSLMADGTQICASTSDAPSVTAFAVRGADGAKALLVVDYLGKDGTIDVAVKGVDAGAKASVKLLSDACDFAETPVEWADGRLRLVKPDTHSAAFLVRFGK